MRRELCDDGIEGRNKQQPSEARRVGAGESRAGRTASRRAAAPLSSTSPRFLSRTLAVVQTCLGDTLGIPPELLMTGQPKFATRPCPGANATAARAARRSMSANHLRPHPRLTDT